MQEKKEIKVNKNGKVKVYWSDYPENYSRESRNRVKKYFSSKYGIAPQNINVIYKPSKRNSSGELVEIDGANIESIMSTEYQRKLFKEWWEQDWVPDDILEARVAMIFKKGDSTKFEIYRPISLLNSTYKIFAAIVVTRTQEGVDDSIQETQFGFRKGRSAADAIHCVRNVLTQARGTHNETILTLLDWEKALDKVKQEAIPVVMERFGVDRKLINIVKALYRNPTFMVFTCGALSYRFASRRHAAARQRCGRSTYRRCRSAKS